jgi:hyaluronoglucosaminidase
MLLLLLCSAFPAGARALQRPAPPAAAFEIVWNGPSESCSKQLGHPLTLERYGLKVNDNQSFMGSTIACFYHIGLFPTLHGELIGSPCWTGSRPCNSTPWGEINVTSNGGVPQEADLAAHTAAVASDVQQQLPDPDFSGLLIVDYEAWRPLYSECYDSLSLYREYSMRLVRADPKFARADNATAVKLEAERRFNVGAKRFFTATVTAIKSVRPKARVGFYSQGIDGSNTTGGMESNTELLWLWEQVDVLCPSIYPRSLNATKEAEHAAGFVSGAIATAAMVSTESRPAVMPYGRALKTAKGDAFTAGVLAAQIQVAAGLGAEGVILWGASKDYHGDGCATLQAELTGFAGTTMRECVANREECRKQHCSGHGRCVDYIEPRLMQTCLSAAQTTECRCDAGFIGDNCLSRVH